MSLAEAVQFFLDDEVKAMYQQDSEWLKPELPLYAWSGSQASEGGDLDVDEDETEEGEEEE
ncbi:MAG: hypothetical protein U0R19_21460 [Bryobacteraceae bacterium]